MPPSGFLHKMFSSLPRRYDLLNRLLTWGQDQGWRRKAVAECLKDRPRWALDLGCGTGDLALQLARLGGPGTRVLGLDFSLPMLEAARAKARQAKVEIAFIRADAAHLPLRPGWLDAIGSSFTLRNLTYRNPGAGQYLSQAHKALRPGGRWVTVETSQPPGSLVRWAFHSYLRRLVPSLGGLISGNQGAYRYLAGSALGFFPAEEVSRMLLKTGFQRVTFRRFLRGAIAIHTAIK